MRLIQELLIEQYDITTCNSGSKCLEIVKELTPDVFLLDIKMPAMDGFELCQKLRSQPAFRHTLIIFLSRLDSLEEKIAGFDSGADDFITKPFQIDILAKKLEANLKRIKSVEASVAQTLEKTAVSGSEISQINYFFEQLNQCRDYYTLAKHLLDSCEAFGVSAAIQVRGNGADTINMSTTGVVSPIEIELMEQEISTEQVPHFNHLCLFNFEFASLLVRRMPFDKDKVMHYRELLSLLMNGFNNRMYCIQLEIAYQKKQVSHIVNVLKDSKEKLGVLLSGFKKQDSQAIAVIENLLTEMVTAFPHLNINEEKKNNKRS
ncbi:response regulator [Aliikangiella sp. IMCC44359]|uniref:response regulator n=1 Tax=Aliikangiella sp. IMCC44359 TaxID=3459125 RepID=UPI00403A8DF2